jgi:methylmalonyl-CoA mutase, N-terminal domain
VANTIDPLGGSYFLERLTLDMEKECYDYFEKIDAMGGMVAAIERGFPQREIQESAYQYQKAVERKDKIIVGVNEFVTNNEHPINVLYIDHTVADHQCQKLKELRNSRSNDLVHRTLKALRQAAQGNENLMPRLVDCVEAYATLGEICDEMKTVFGVYEEPVF